MDPSMPVDPAAAAAAAAMAAEQQKVFAALFIELTGPVFVGSILGWFLFGILTLQMYTYITSERHTREQLWIKLLVWFVYAVAFLQLVTGTRWVWKQLVQHWGETNVYTSTIIFEDAADVLSVPITDGTLSGAVELFLAWRIWALSKNIYARITVGLIVAVSLLSSICAWYIGIHLFVNGGTGAVLMGSSKIIGVWSVALFISDMLIAITLTIILLQRRKKSPMRQTEKLIDRIILITVETGLVTALLGPIHLGMYYGLPANYVHITPDMIVGKLYANVLLVTLNSRGATKSPAVYQNNPSGNSDFVSLSGARRAIVNVETETYKNTTSHGDFDASADIEMKNQHKLPHGSV